MAVVIEAFSVVIRREAIEAKFPGGLDAFAEQAPNNTLCADAELVRLGFMTPQDVEAYVTSLENQGLVYLEDGSAKDLNVLDQFRGPNFEDDWLNFGQVEMEGEKVSIAWVGEPDGRLAVPEGWRPGRVQFAREHDGDRLRFLRREGNVDVYEDLLTGKEVFTGRTLVEDGGEAGIRNWIEAMFHQVMEIEQKLAGERDPKVVSELHRQLREEIVPLVETWRGGFPQALLVGGLAHRLLGDLLEAEVYFRTGHEVAPEANAFLLELVRLLGSQNRPEEALPFARKAVEVDSIDPGAWGNLAMCLIQCGEMDEARRALREALLLDPNDSLNQTIRDHFFKGEEL
jgi:tetratricopeptide (TPR) repeat protein